MASVTSWDEFEQLCSAELLYIRAAVVKDPTDLSIAFPYGGTVLGGTTAHEYTLEPVDGVITAHEFGGLPVNVLDNGYVARFAMMLQTFDYDALGTILPGVTQSTRTGKAIIAPTLANMRGRLGTSRVYKLLVVPRDAENEPTLYFPCALNQVGKSMRAARLIESPWGVPIMATGLPDSTGRPVIESLLEDVTL